MKILIADDDRTLVELLSTRLRAKGEEVSVAFDSTQALMGAMRVKPDVILLDIKMPGGTGLDTLKKLKANTRTAMVPVVVMSALSDPQVPQTVVGLGAAEFLPKPVHFDAVYATLRRVLGEMTDGKPPA